MEETPRSTTTASIAKAFLSADAWAWYETNMRIPTPKSKSPDIGWRVFAIVQKRGEAYQPKGLPTNRKVVS